ncbi:hypothetical protein ACFV1N_21050 [Streptosporangium canum]|uniref:hypothetical protein n=1 Tax=Streptosporangium canum TaxID=324952 RepID=UPI0036925820
MSASTPVSVRAPHRSFTCFSFDDLNDLNDLNDLSDLDVLRDSNVLRDMNDLSVIRRHV